MSALKQSYDNHSEKQQQLNGEQSNKQNPTHPPPCPESLLTNTAFNQQTCKFICDLTFAFASYAHIRGLTHVNWQANAGDPIQN